jgi:hypothetical protein
MTATAALLLEWEAVLKQYTQALTSYTVAIDDVALKSRPTARTKYRQALANAEKLATLPLSDITPEQTFTVLADLDTIRQNLDDGTAVVLDPSLLGEAVRWMSRSYVEEVERLAKHLRDARTKTLGIVQPAVRALVEEWAPRVATATDWRISGRTLLRQKASPSALALCVAVLRIWLDQATQADRPAVTALIEDMKDCILGVEPDTPAAVQKAVAARAGLHPIQAMEITFGLVPGPEVEAPPAVRLDLTLPQAGTAVHYDLAPLVDARRASEFGPIASANSGLNFRLVERLRTITENLLPPSAPETAATHEPGAADDTRIARTIDRGKTYEELLPPAGKQISYAAVGAGPRPRVERLGILLEEAIFGQTDVTNDIRAIADLDRLLEGYQCRPEADPDFSLDELGQVLIATFTSELAKTPAASADEFFALLQGQRGCRDPYRTYIARAVSKVTKRAADRQLLRSEARGGGATKLFGSQILAARGSRQEVLLTQVTTLRRQITAIQKKLEGAFVALNGHHRARSIFNMPVDSVGATAARRLQILELYRAVIDEAFYSPRRPTRRLAAKSVEKGDTIETRPSLKLYVLEAGGSIS